MRIIYKQQTKDLFQVVSVSGDYHQVRVHRRWYQFTKDMFKKTPS